MKGFKIAGLALVLLSFSSVGGAAQPWVARHGMTAAQYQTEFNQRAGQGYRLAHLSGYTVGAEPQFAGIWERRSGPAQIARHGMTAADYQSEFQKQANDGYRLVLVDGYAVGGQPRYVAIWDRSTGPARVARHGLTAAQYQSEFTRLTGEGYRLVLVNGYGVGPTVYYAGIWERRTGPQWSSRHGMTAAQYQAEFDSRGQQGYRLTHLSSYTAGNQDLYAAIWERTTGPAWAARHRMTANAYQAEFVDRGIQGYRLKAVSGYAMGGSARYAAIWEAEPDALTGSFCHNGQCFELQRFADNIQAALRGKPFVKYAFEVRRGTQVIQHAAGPKRTAATPPASNFTPFDRFNPASVSKTITAVATLQLLAKRNISLDAPIHTHLPPSWNIPAANRVITFREVLNHRSGLRGAGIDGHEYEHIRTLLERPINAGDRGTEQYENVNYSLLRILVSSLDGYNQWVSNPGPGSSARFIAYVNREIFSPLGIYNVTYQPDAVAPTLFYPHAQPASSGTTYGNWSNRPGSAGAHTSVHDLAVFAAATFNGTLLPPSMVEAMKQHGLGVGDYGATPDGRRCWGKGGFFPGEQNGGAELNSVLVHCDSGVTAMLVINGQLGSKSILMEAYNAAFTPQPVRVR